MTEYYRSRLQTIRLQIEHMRKNHGDFLDTWSKAAQDRLYQLRFEKRVIENEKLNNDLYRT